MPIYACAYLCPWLRGADPYANITDIIVYSWTPGTGTGNTRNVRRHAPKTTMAVANPRAVRGECGHWHPGGKCSAACGQLPPVPHVAC